MNPGALEDPSLRDRIAKRLDRDRAGPAALAACAVQDHEGREELARGALRQAVVVVDGADPGRAGRRPARAGRRCWPGAARTRSTAASGPGCTPSSATRPSAAARPRSRRTSSPTGRSPCPASRAPDRAPSRCRADPRATCIIGVARHTWHPDDVGATTVRARAARHVGASGPRRRGRHGRGGRAALLGELESIDVVYSQSWQYDDAVDRLAERLGRVAGPAALLGHRRVGPPRAGRRGGRGDPGGRPRPRAARRRGGVGHRPPPEEGRRAAAVVVPAGREAAVPDGHGLRPLRDQPLGLRGLPDLRAVRQRAAGPPRAAASTSTARPLGGSWRR